MEKPTTLYSLYQLALTSGNINTIAQLEFVKRSGERTELDNFITYGTIAEVRRDSSIKSCPSWHKLCICGADPFEILFKTRDLNHFGKGKFNRREEECLLILKKNQLNIFVFKNPKALSNCISNPLYWHNYWPYTSSEKECEYPSIAKDDRAEQKFIRNEQSIVDEMNSLIKNLSKLPDNNYSGTFIQWNNIS